MDKQAYKEMLADEVTKSSELKSKLDEIKTLVLDNSNNMELGKKVRNLFPLGEVGENQIKLF
tara:strand:+ start:451 stop:636 length:186 start_codon:yes stop_codon:yes gene_type:complete